MQPGRSVTAVYKLTNNSDRQLQITPAVYSFEPSGEEGQIKILNAERSTLNANFSFESREEFGQSFDLAVGQTKELVLKIALPKASPEKDHYYTLLFSSAEIPLDMPGEGGKSGAVAQIGANILLTVSQTGKTVLQGAIAEFSAPTIIDSFSPIDFKVILTNRGKNFWKPFGQIEIKGPFKQKGEIRLLEQNVLADSSRRLSIEPYKTKYPLGPFKAKLSISLNEDGPGLSSEIVFWYLPYKALGLIIMLSLLAIIIKKRVRKVILRG